ncbi:MAG: SPOR domain-containing protein [Rhodospirillales bacterium]|jgi:cell division septation protein DedD|nr:SPOR domain-containing protein [Rhodospirillales bacterium]
MVPADEQGEEIVPDPSDALEFEAVKRVKPKRRGLWLFLLLLVIGGGAGASWYFYGDMLVRGQNNDVPVIRAAEGSVKVRPKNPGGMSVPDRDKLVYDRMKGGVEEPRVERLLPPPEMPKTPPIPASEPTSETKVAEASPSVKKPKQLPKPQKLEPGKIDLKKLTPKKKASEPSPAPAPQVAASVVSGLAYQIQIAAVRTAERAESELERLKKKHGNLLGGYTLNVVRADLGADKGIFFRLRAGPIAGEDVAKALCQNLSKRKVDCRVVRPGN